MAESGTRRLHSCALAALGALHPGGGSSAISEFLRNHAAAPHCSWRELLEICCRNPDPADRPLLDLAASLGLSRTELLTIALAAAVETDMMCGRAIADLQAPVGGSRPTLGLLAAAFSRLTRHTSQIPAMVIFRFLPLIMAYSQSPPAGK